MTLTPSSARRKRHPRKNLLLAVLCLATFGCVTSTTSSLLRTTYQTTEPSKIEILYEEPSRAYEVLGYVEVSVWGGIVSQSRIDRAFQAEAYKLGAQAVLIQNPFHYPNFGQSDTQGKGKAIIWK